MRVEYPNGSIRADVVLVSFGTVDTIQSPSLFLDGELELQGMILHKNGMLWSVLTDCLAFFKYEL